MKPAKPKNLESIYQLSPVQEGILFHSLYEPTEGLYFLQLGFTLHGALNVAMLKQAWGEVFARHAVLRTGFEWEGLEKPAQVVYRHVALPFEELDWRHLEAGERQAAFEDLLRQDQTRGFELRKAPLVRLTLARGAADLHYFVWSFHHLLIDGWCLPLLFEEVFALYSGLLKGRAVRLPPSRPYREFIGWLRGQDSAPAEEFWRGYLAGIEGPTALPLAAMEPEASPGHEVRSVLVPAERLESFARRHRVTVNTLVQGAWALLLARFANQSEVIFGATSSGRSAPIPGIQRMIGLFISTMPVRLRTPDGARLVPWLQEIQTEQATLRQHEFSPLVKVQAWSGQGGGQSLFDTILVFENYPMGEAVDQLRGEVDLEIDMVRNPEAINYPLALIVFEGEQLDLRLNYERRHFSAAAIDRLLGHLRHLLEAMAEDSQRPLAALPLLSRAETEQLIAHSTRVRAEPFEVASLVVLFAAQAARWPERVAVLCGRKMLTYGELDRGSSALAGRLVASGVGSEDRVGLFAPRGLGLALGILGILKAGAVYVPLDPKAPAARISYILEDARVRVVVVSDEASGPPVHEGETVSLEGAIARIEVVPALPEAAQSADHAAYVIYTSGSTGQPKGVVVSHGNVARLFAATEEALELSEEDVWTLFHSFAFDFSVYELWGALLFGGRLVVVPRWTVVSPEEFCDLLTEQRVTVLCQTPSAFRSLIPVATACGTSFFSLRSVLFGGEMLDFSMLLPWCKVFGDRHPRLINLYGITETTVHVTVREVVEDDLALGRSAVGPPMVDLDLFVLDHRLEIVVPGVIGELCVGGPGLARGYLAQPRQTAARFVPNPFAVKPGARLYRSGDLGRRFGDGFSSSCDLEVLGRMDQQVKVRGFRIELGEVEAALRALPGIADGVVLVRKEALGGSLVAYVVPEEGAGESTTASVVASVTAFSIASVEAFRRDLAGSLPDYMIPGAFVTLAELPLTLNSKLDRKALANFAPVEAAPTAVKPRGVVEEILAGIWSEVLEGGKTPGAFDNFFALGGHSLLVTRVTSRIRSILGVEIPIKDFFETPTLAGLAVRVEDAQLGQRQGGSKAFPPLVPRPVEEEPELSFAQERLWLEDQLGAAARYNMPVAVRLRGHLDPAAAADSISEIVRRHEVLRTVYPARDGAPFGRVEPPEVVPLPMVDLRALPAATRRGESECLLAREVMRPFDLAAGPLLRCLLLRLAEEEQLLFFNQHHVISDAWSLGILVEEFGALYAARAVGRPSPLPELSFQYADYAHWQRRFLSGEVLERQLAYWQKRFAVEPPPLELSASSAPSDLGKDQGAQRALLLPKELADALGELSRRRGATLFMTLLAGFFALLYRETGSQDLTVGSAVAGRDRLESEGLIGCFINLLALRVELEGGLRFRQLLDSVREVALEAYAHQELPFERLVEELWQGRDQGGSPVQITFGLQNAPSSALELPGLEVEAVELKSAVARLDLTVWVLESSEGLQISWTWRRSLYSDVAIERLHRRYTHLLESATKNPETRLDALQLAPQGTAEEGAVEQVRSKSFAKFRKKAGRRAAVPGGLPR